MNEIISQWTIFFEALDLKCRELQEAPTPGLEIANFYGDGKHKVWMPVPKFPQHGLIEDASHYADDLGQHVYLVIGPPEVPQVKQWPDGFLYVEGAVGISLAPLSASLGGERLFLFDPRWHALHEDFWGSLDIRPLYADAMPVGEKQYSKIALCPAVLGEPIVGIYFGCGRTPAGPRLRAAYEALGADKLSA